MFIDIHEKNIEFTLSVFQESARHLHDVINFFPETGASRKSFAVSMFSCEFSVINDPSSGDARANQKAE